MQAEGLEFNKPPVAELENEGMMVMAIDNQCLESPMRLKPTRFCKSGI